VSMVVLWLVAGCWACVTGASCFPVAAGSVAAGWAGQGPGGARPHGGAGGVLEATGPEPGDAGSGEREPGCGAIWLLRSVPLPGLPVRAVPLAALVAADGLQLVSQHAPFESCDRRHIDSSDGRR
jgi:hypothetical protein